MRLGSFALVAGAVLALAAPASAAQQVLYVGDSLGVGTTPGLAHELGSEASVHGDSRIGRPSGEGLGVLRRAFSLSDQIVVFDIGTNDDPAQPRRLANDLAGARQLTGDRCLIVATLNRPPLNGVPVDGLNRAVLAFADSAAAVQLVDWNAIVASEPSLLGPDRVHPTPQGYAVRAQLFAEAVASCSAAPQADDPALSPDPDQDQPAPVRPRTRRKPKRQIKVPGIESSGISFTEPVELAAPQSPRATGELLLPNTKPPWPAIVLVHGAAGDRQQAFHAQAEYFAEHGIAALVYDRHREGVSGEAGYARLAVDLLRARDDIRPGGIGLWGFGRGATAAARAAAPSDHIAALVLVSPSPLDSATVRDWAVRSAVGGKGAGAVRTWLATNPPDDPFAALDTEKTWKRLSQPVLAIWGTRDRFIPIRDSAARLRDLLAAGPNRDRTFQWFDASHAGAVVYREGEPVFAPGFLEETASWLAARLGKGKVTPVVRTPLPPANGKVRPAEVSRSTATAPATQIAWLLLPALLLAAAAIRRRRATDGLNADAPSGTDRRLIAATAVACIAALGCIAAGIADVLASDGRGVTKLAGIPWLFALAFVFAAVGAALTIRLARERAWLAAGASAAWVALALFWLL